MEIAIIGTGKIGGSLAAHWARAGHQIRLGVRNPQVSQYAPLLDLPNTTMYAIGEAVRLSNVILVATPAAAVLELIPQFGEVHNKIIIDATNSGRKNPDPYPTATHAWVDQTNAEVVKCFNCTGFENVKAPQYGDHALDMFMAGESEQAKIVAEQLAKEAGFENCYDFGGLEKVELLEQFAQIWINLAFFQGLGRDFGFKVLKR